MGKSSGKLHGRSSFEQKSRSVSSAFRSEFYRVITAGKYDSLKAGRILAESPVQNKNRNSNWKTFSDALVGNGRGGGNRDGKLIGVKNDGEWERGLALSR